MRPPLTLSALLFALTASTSLAQPSSPTPTLCGPGFYSPTGFAPCSPCPVGTYNPQTGQMECSPCPVGTFAAYPGQSQCNICPAGTFQGQTRGQSCALCPAGRFGPYQGMTSCLACATGLTNTAAGATVCLPCPAGFFFSPGGAGGAGVEGSCQPCPFGADCSIAGNACPTELVWREGGSGPGGYIAPSCQTACTGGPPVIVVAPMTSIRTYTGEVIDIIVDIYSNPAAGTPTFYWRHNGVTMLPEGRILGENLSHLIITDAVPGDSGQYDVVVSNNCGWVTSTAAIVQVDCKADFNHSGTVSVQDLFDFLTAYFRGIITADLNHTATFTVQDLFDYLAAYFTPCL